ncbi:PE family protein, partial [Mycobacterium tuberculosis]
ASYFGTGGGGGVGGDGAPGGDGGAGPLLIGNG